MDHRQKILNEARELIRKSREAGLTTEKEVTLKSGSESSLAKVINTQEKADLFMKILKAL